MFINREFGLRFLLLFMGLMAAGCATISSPNREMANDGEAVQVGMSQSEIKQIMGDRVIVGYERSKEKPDQFIPITLQNPYRSEVLESRGKTYEIFFYFIYLKRADGVITDDELIPLVFENSKLIGKGWQFLDSLIDLPSIKQNFKSPDCAQEDCGRFEAGKEKLNKKE